LPQTFNHVILPQVEDLQVLLVEVLDEIVQGSPARCPRDDIILDRAENNQVNVITFSSFQNLLIDGFRQTEVMFR